jgi:hypothetical protein
MPKHTDAIAEREQSRARLIELRTEARQRRTDLDRFVANLGEVEANARREYKRLVDLTAAVAQLLHADLAGIGAPERTLNEKLDALAAGHGGRSSAPSPIVDASPT